MEPVSITTVAFLTDLRKFVVNFKLYLFSLESDDPFCGGKSPDASAMMMSTEGAIVTPPPTPEHHVKPDFSRNLVLEEEVRATVLSNSI